MKNSLFVALVVLSTSLFSQTFNSPESVEYDAANSRWIVGQNGSGEIHILSPLSGTLSPFATGIASGPHGIEVLGSVVYCCDGPRIKGFNISTGALVFNVNLGATFLNGLTSDGGNFLFATDFTAKRIYRINTVTSAFNIMRATTYSPNGIIYDAPNNRCVFVNWGANARVEAMSMVDSLITPLYITGFSNIDGITRDQAGYWYISTWGGNALRRFDPTFTAAPVSVMTGLFSPADIDINANGDSIGIPNSGTANNVVFYTNITTSINETISSSLELYPNPSPGAFSLALDEAIINGTISIYDVSGKLISEQKATGYKFTFDRGDLPAGIYSVMVRNTDGQVVGNKKLMLGE